MAVGRANGLENIGAERFSGGDHALESTALDGVGPPLEGKHNEGCLEPLGACHIKSITRNERHSYNL